MFLSMFLLLILRLEEMCILYISMYVCAYIYMCVCVRVCVCVCFLLDIYIYIYLTGLDSVFVLLDRLSYQG